MFDALLCRNWPFSPPNRVTLRITLLHQNCNLTLHNVSWHEPLPFLWEKYFNILFCKLKNIIKKVLWIKRCCALNYYVKICLNNLSQFILGQFQTRPLSLEGGYANGSSSYFDMLPHSHKKTINYLSVFLWSFSSPQRDSGKPRSSCP